MPLLPSPPFSSLCSKAERAFYDFIVNNQVAVPKPHCFTGHDSDEKVPNRVEISARGGPEEPIRSGNYKINVAISVVGSADESVDDGSVATDVVSQPPEEMHARNAATVFDILTSPICKDWLNRVVADFYVFDFLTVDLDHSVEGRNYRDTLVLEVYCCAARIIPQFPLGGTDVETPPT